jgi:hypothetical protein
MITGLEFDTPILGTVRMGEVRPGEAGASEEVVHFDYFEVHSRRKNPDGTWAKHQLHDELLEKLAEAKQSGAGDSEDQQEPVKLRQIPIQFQYNNPDLLLTQQFEARRLSDGQRVCVGDGEKAIRIVDGNRAQETECQGCDRCPFGHSQDVLCQRRTSLTFRIEGQSDEFAAFVLHSAGRNTAQTLVAKLHAMHGAFGGRLVGIPMSLKMRYTASADAASGPVFFADIVLRPGVKPFEAVKMAIEYEKQQQEAGFDQERLEEAMLELKRASRFAPPEDFGQVRDLYRRSGGHSWQEVIPQSSDAGAVNSCANFGNGQEEGEQQASAESARLSEVSPVAGARQRMRAAAALGASNIAAAKRDDQGEAPVQAMQAVEPAGTLQLVAPAPADVAAETSSDSVVMAPIPLVTGAPIPHVAVKALASIPAMPQVPAATAAF